MPTLSAFIDVANIPKKYGGELDFESGMKPVLDSAVLNVLDFESVNGTSAETTFLTAPVRWIDGKDGDLIALGVGSDHGHERREFIATLRSEVAKHAFPGMSRQNTQSAYSGISRQSTLQQQQPKSVLTDPSNSNSLAPPPPPLLNGAATAPTPQVSIPPTVEGGDAATEYVTPASTPSQLK